MSQTTPVALVEYGAGNSASVIKALVASGAAVRRACTPAELTGAGLIVIPGVGHFGATASLDADWRRAINAQLDAGASVLGICLGLQWLFDGSDEAPSTSGLGRFSGTCFRLSGDVKVPHVGWNTLRLCQSSAVFDGVPAGASVYFTHTFAAPIVQGTNAVATHGVDFSAGVHRGRIVGTQFHPEKSGAVGLRILSNILTLARRA